MMSEVRKFRTQPPTGPEESFSFVVYGDMGVTAVPGAHETADYMIEEALDGKSFVFHVGDISYARGYVSAAVTNRLPKVRRIFGFSFFFKMRIRINAFFSTLPHIFSRHASVSEGMQRKWKEIIFAITFATFAIL